jgi:tetraacyldisaccharide 4'-kinase
MRAAFEAQLAHVHAVLIVGSGGRGREIAESTLGAGKPVVTARMTPRPREAERFAAKPVVAFAGLGRPQKFFKMLEQIRADIRAQHSFPDHHAYTARELASLREQAHGVDAVLVTTEKDLLRLQPAHRNGIDALAVELVFDNPGSFASLLNSVAPTKIKA